MFQLRSHHYWLVPWRLSTSAFFTMMNGSAQRHSAHSTMSHPHDLYKVLGVRDGATQAQIKSAYYKLSKKYHPDRNDGSKNSQDIFLKINEAYSVLGNSKLRRRYDRGVLTHRERMGHHPSHHHQEPREKQQHSYHTGDQNFTTSFRGAYSEHMIDEFLKRRLRENMGRYQENKAHRQAREEEYKALQQRAKQTPVVIFSLMLLTFIVVSAKIMGKDLPGTTKAPKRQ